MPPDDLNFQSSKEVTPEIDFNQLIFEEKVHQRLYTDQRIFRVEMEKIFGAVWVFIAHESQIPKKK
tara:strand:+ start:100 stop:297 length:198 start_codon:yes stop_codon:yes gene_type:complete